MSNVEAILHEAWQRRWLPPDWQRWMRPDAHRVASPGVEAKGAPATPAADAELAAELRRLQAQQDSLRRTLAGVKFELALRRLRRKYSPDQPRVPAGNGRESGRWTDGGGGDRGDLFDGRVRVAQAGSIVTDAFGEPYYRPGGHHEMPKQIYQKWNLTPETRTVFEKSTTGTIPQMWLRTSPDGVPVGNFWNGENGAHANYNKAVKELSDRYLETNKITPTEMTPDHARGLLKEIRESQDPRIRDFNGTMKLIRRLFPLRTGRGNE